MSAVIPAAELAIIPTSAAYFDGAAVAAAAGGPVVLVAVGGGSPIDAAKGIGPAASR